MKYAGLLVMPAGFFLAVAALLYFGGNLNSEISHIGAKI